jgi:two-component system NarL family sensor kinase
MQPTESRILLIITLGTLLLITSSIFIIVFLFYFRRKQVVNKQEKASLQAQFNQEILKSQIEVQNTTLQQIGQELHDNIGQLLSVARINLNILEATKQNEENKEYIKQTNEIIAQSIQDLRSLTKSLDGDFVKQFGLQESMTHELQRIRKTKKFSTEITLKGAPYTLGFEREIILFRIFQEFLNNAIKHSQAKNLLVALDYGVESFNLILLDDGKGFDFEKAVTHTLLDSGAGLRNINRRCELINAKCHFETAVGQGTKIMIALPNDNNGAGI